MADEPRILGTSAHGLLVVHKPAGMRVHPANDDGVPDLLTWLRTQGSIPPDTAPVQRLDQGTSGLLLCGATSNHRAMASAWLTEGLVEKTYLTGSWANQKEGHPAAAAPRRPPRPPPAGNDPLPDAGVARRLQPAGGPYRDRPQTPDPPSPAWDRPFRDRR